MPGKLTMISSSHIPNSAMYSINSGHSRSPIAFDAGWNDLEGEFGTQSQIGKFACHADSINRGDPDCYPRLPTHLSSLGDLDGAEKGNDKSHLFFAKNHPGCAETIRHHPEAFGKECFRHRHAYRSAVGEGVIDAFPPRRPYRRPQVSD